MKPNKTNALGLKKLTNRKKKCNPQDDAPAEVLREPKNWITSFSKLVKSCGTLRSSQNKTILSSEKPPSSTSLCSSLPSLDKLIESKNEPIVETMISTSLTQDGNISTEPCHEVLLMYEHNKHHQREDTIPEKVSEKNVPIPLNNISLESTVTEKQVVVNGREKPVGVIGSGFSKPPLSMMNRNQSSGYRQYSQAGIKPRGVQRNVTENSNVSLHRRQQPLDLFEFDTASLRRITSTATDSFNEKESDMISLPKTIDFNMRAVSAMTTLSDEGDIDDLDAADNYFAIDDDDDKEEDNRWTVSPTSVVDICQAPTTADAWMLEWATVPQNKDNELKLTQTLSNELNSTAITMDCSESTVTLESSLTDPEDLQVDPVYVPSVPLPLMAASPIEGNIYFAGWLAVNAETSWIDNEGAIVGKEAVQFVQVISPIAGSEREGNLLIRISTDDEFKIISLCASTCQISTRIISKRMGCCLVLTDGNIELCLLPVNVIPLRLLSKKREPKLDAKTCEVLFMPFKKAFDLKEQHYAPDSQHDAVIHLSFSVDIALRDSHLR